jgi:hypothetical protein
MKNETYEILLSVILSVAVFGFLVFGCWLATLTDHKPKDTLGDPAHTIMPDGTIANFDDLTK